MPTGNKVLITGSSGMLGTDLSQELEKDYIVEGVDTVESPHSRLAGFRKGDITDRRDMAAAVSAARPAVVIHCAAWTDVDGCETDKAKALAVNSEGTENVALACKKAGAVIVYISTDFVFDGRLARPYIETDKTGPLSAYGASKLLGEGNVSAVMKEHFILRTSWLYGAYGKNFVDTIIAKGSSGNPLKIVDDQAGSPTYTKDLAEAVHALLDRVTGNGSRVTGYGIYHVSNAGIVSWCDYAKAILRIAGIRTEAVPISSAQLARPARRPAMSALDNSKFVKFTGYRMRPWEDALREYIERKTGQEGNVC